MNNEMKYIPTAAPPHLHRSPDTMSPHLRQKPIVECNKDSSVNRMLKLNYGSHVAVMKYSSIAGMHKSVDPRSQAI